MASTVLKQVKDRSLVVTSGLVAGSWRQGKDGKAFHVYEPSSRDVLSDCADLGHRDFLDAIKSAEKRTQSLRRKTAKERSEMLRKWYNLIMEHKGDLAFILSLENGKTLADARGEVVYIASDTTVLTYKEPIGVCGLITPWNFPAAMVTRKVAPAIAAGCAAVLKPPSETPFTSLALAKLALQAGIPSDVVHVVPTTDREASMELVRNPAVKKISFTGSTRVGKILTKVAAETMKRVHSHVQDALSKGAKLHTGGKPLENSSGFFYTPTVLSHVTTDMDVATDETFGPLAAIFSFASEEEAIGLANATELGLAGYFHSKDVNSIMRISQLLECGIIGVNTGLISAAEVPFGGVKERGLGREGSKYGLA